MAKLVCQTKNVKETEELGCRIGMLLKEPICIALTGDLGAGKTHFSQGLAKGLGIREKVTSPTFTIINSYDTGRFPFYHVDLYRLEDEEELEAIGFHEYLSDAVSVIEWANKFPESFPENVVYVRIEATDKTERRFYLESEWVGQEVLEEWGGEYVLRD